MCEVFTAYKQPKRKECPSDLYIHGVLDISEAVTLRDASQADGFRGTLSRFDHVGRPHYFSGTQRRHLFSVARGAR